MNTTNRRDTLQALRTRGLAVPHSISAQIERDIPDREARKWALWAAVWDRPTAANWEYNDAELAAAQARWDESRAFVDAQNAASAELESRKAQEAERQRIEAEKRDAAYRESLLAKPRRAFLAAGGTPEAWESVKDEIAATIATQAAVNAATAV